MKTSVSRVSATVRAYLAVRADCQNPAGFGQRKETGMTDPRTQATRTQMDTGGIGRTVPSGWAFFAGIILFMVGVFNIIWGLTALFNDTALTVGEQGLIVWDFTAWGWIHLILGIVMIATALGLFGGQGWARWTAVVFVMVNAFGQIAWMSTYPLWSILIITLDIIIIYQLTVRWDTADSYWLREARASRRPRGPAPRGRRHAPRRATRGSG